MEDMILYESTPLSVKPAKDDYCICGTSKQTIKRDVDFGVIPGTKKPTLFKSGAEKICLAFGLFQRYTLESKIEQTGDHPFFYYLVKCELVKLNPADGKEYVFTTGYGSANTGEKRCGFSGAYDGANSSLKMAQKRALVSAAVSIGGVSDMFTQDMDNEDFMNKSKDLVATNSEDAPITTKQIRLLYALAEENGMNSAMAKNKIIALGYASTKDIKQKDFDALRTYFQNGAEGEFKKEG